MQPQFFFISCFVILFHSSALAQGILRQLPEDEQDAIEAVALYPPKERAAVLTVAQHPEILVRMDHIRRSTEARFKELTSDVPQEELEKIYNLSRYPELLAAITDRDKRRSNNEMDDLLKGYAEEIHDDAHDLNRKNFDLLKDIHALDMEAEADFESMLSAYPSDVRDACRELAQLPAIVSVLTGNMSMTVLLGDIYQKHPVQLNRELDSLNVVLAEQQARELEDWKKELEENPEAMAEYEAAAKEFAGEEEYDDDVYEGPIPDRYRQDVYVHHVWRPYSYWFGWPSWYGYELWYPYPWWYHWGYYYGPGQSIVIVGLPSNFFFDWHFHHNRNFYYYPHFTDHVFRHYYGPRQHGTRVQPVLRQWEREHRNELPNDWMKDDKDRVNRIREYGKFKMEYEDLVSVTRDKAPTEREYLRSNANRYPTLKPVLKEKPDAPRSQPQAQPPKTRTEEPVRREQPDYQPGEKVIQKDVPRQEEIDRAKEQHEKTWDRQRTQPRPQQPAPSTAPTRRETPKSQPRTAPTRQVPPKSQPPQAPPRKKD